jgi:hypothetical protein
MNRLNFDKRVQAIHCLVEGNSIRSTERLGRVCKGVALGRA